MAARLSAVPDLTSARSGVPTLRVMPARRRAAWFVVLLTVLSGAAMTGRVLVHTRLAERQLEIDALGRTLRDEQAAFDTMRAQRAELRSPTRLAEAAGLLGMRRGLESEFIAVDPWLLAVTIARTGQVPGGDGGADLTMQPLDQFRVVKALSEEAP